MIVPKTASALIKIPVFGFSAKRVAMAMSMVTVMLVADIISAVMSHFSCLVSHSFMLCLFMFVILSNWLDRGCRWFVYEFKCFTFWVCFGFCFV